MSPNCCKMDLKKSRYVKLVLCMLMIVSTHKSICQECPEVELVELFMTENCNNDATNILSVNITCRAQYPFLIWYGDLFGQELAITVVSSDHTFILKDSGLQVTDSNSLIESDCLQSTLTFSGPNLSSINNEVISCRTVTVIGDSLFIELPTYIEMINEFAACAHTFQNCSSSQNSEVNVNLTVDGRSMDYEVLAPMRPTGNCTNSVNNTFTVLDESCNKTIMVSTTTKSCNSELKYILSSADTQQFVNVGDPFLLELKLENPSGTLYNFSWTKNGIHYEKNVTATSIYISITKLSDAGIYNVTATSNSSSASAFFTLIILCSPEFENSTSMLNFTRGEKFTITCNTTNFCSLPTNITLEVSTKDFFETMVFYLEQNSKQFTSATQNSSGNYTCIASTDYNTTTFVYQVQVLNSSDPNIPGNEKIIIGASIGASIVGLLLVLVSIPITIGCYVYINKRRGQMTAI